MVKFVKLSAPVFLDCDHLRLETGFSKTAGGYRIEAVPVQKSPGSYSVVYGPEYFSIRQYMEELLIPAGRKSGKKEFEADELLIDHWRDYVDNFLARIGKADLKVV